MTSYGTSLVPESLTDLYPYPHVVSSATPLLIRWIPNLWHQMKESLPLPYGALIDEASWYSTPLCGAGIKRSMYSTV